MTFNALDVANKIVINTDIDKGDLISNLKLQKMLYYLQGFNLAFFDEKLFDDDIEAWQYGPVVPSVYYNFKDFGKGAIILSEAVEEIHLNNEEQEDMFRQVLEEYGKFNAIRLMEMTHEELPWKSTEIKKVIDTQVMKAYFKTLVEYSK
ncbi:MAG: DUF4065 domain-containing protein [Chitinophagaceae bacterium]